MKSPQTIHPTQLLLTCARGSDRRRTGIFVCNALLSLIVFLAVPWVSFGQQGTLTDDAYTPLKDKNKTTGDESRLQVKGINVDGGSNAYVKFKLTPSLPQNTAGDNIARATLKLFVGNIHAAGSFDLYRVLGPANAWSEDTLTTTLAGQNLTLNLESANVPVGSSQQFVTVDVTQLVKDWLDGGLPNNGIAIAGNASSLDVDFDSKENSNTSHLPALEIVLNAVRRVSADSPLSVTNPTTTPNISLGTVPVANGGTGLNSAGSAGNLLRSDGSAWTSVPFSSSDVPAGSGNYIQNSTSQQSVANFNISGNGTADTFDAATQFKLGGFRIISQQEPLNNFFVGLFNGVNNTTGVENHFFGGRAGFSNTTGSGNSFFGARAGESNTTGGSNSFFGANAGAFNSTGGANSFFGLGAGYLNTFGDQNAFFGSVAGDNNTTGAFNAFFGSGAGRHNTTGTSNIFIGTGAGNPDAATQVSNSIAIGRNVTVSSSNTIVIGRSEHTTHIPGQLEVSGGGLRTFNDNLSGLLVDNLLVRRLGSGDIMPSPAPACIRIVGVGGDGGFGLTTCTTSSSSIRYKTGLHPFLDGLEVIKRLKPTTFTWKASGERDVGLIAEQVAEVEPLFTYKNAKGEIEGIKYANMSVIFINAIKEQQAQINQQQQQIQAQQAQLKQQEQQINRLTKLVSHRRVRRRTSN